MSAMKKLEKFAGVGDVERWIDKFEFAVVVDEVIDAKKAARFLAMNLDAAAYDAWKGMKEEDKDDAGKIKKQLRDTFGMRKSAAWRAIVSRRISPGESLDAACEEFHKWVRIVSAGSDPVLAIATAAFIEALPMPVAQKVKMICGGAASRTEVLKVAKDIWDEDIGEEVAAAACRSVQGESRQQYHKATQSPLARPRLCNEERHCFGCGEVGHLCRNCRATCDGCGGHGHSQVFCKRQSENCTGGL